MYRKGLQLTILLTALCMTAACDKGTTVPSQDSGTVGHTQTAPSPSIEQSNTEGEGDVEPTKEPATPSDNKLAALGFDTISKLELNGYSCIGFVALNANEVIAAISSNGEDDTKIVRIDLNSGRTSVIQESSDDDQIIGYTIALSDNGIVQWRTYSQKETVLHTYQLDENQKVIRIDDTKESPDGRWVADPTYNNPNLGISGTDQSTGERKQWTTGPKDDQPLWLPDSSGFLFLHDTGDNLGDGAGPKYQLARFDIRSNKMTVLSFESGYWGTIEWLEPGVSVLAHNGFDDVVGLKIVNLNTNKEYQVVDSSNFDYLSSTINPINHHLLVSDQGAFKAYGSNGELSSDTSWPTGFDEFTNKYNSIAGQSEGQAAEIYYAGGEQGGTFGPSHPSISPDGKQLAYLLGAIGESTGDKVEGTRIALANSDGNGTKLVTQNYARISNLQWSPDGTAIIALFTLDQDRKQYYMGTIQAAP
ncbi:hypothetical protein PCCS19_02880 [Paenibacillus sp. CCS19]|uniref:TolB family protein n=1 Tax=Paenibacillus sp. CCS19 TaxID=3158387 RepID=UPI002566AAC7|nr:hypothetical protein [Paenibacillus cellulosilyticus]GMK37235.1 hypothetical protein PCCS19_02880 [Paenibacillus cellulosilyticus]